jgi:hypothetical protein
MSPGTTQGSAFSHADHSLEGKSIDDVFNRIEEPGSWVALYNVETHPDYKVLLDSVICEVSLLVTPEQAGITKVGGFIFISAPPSVTPFHIDRENNFWLQIAGRKTINVWDHCDRDVVSGVDVEEFILSGSLAGVRLKADHRSRSQEFDAGPGDGVYFPSTSPHMTRSNIEWVTPGNGVSISIGVVFYTSATRRDAYVHAFNRVLRKARLSPREPGRSQWLDRVKYPLGLATIWGRRRLRGHQPNASF